METVQVGALDRKKTLERNRQLQPPIRDCGRTAAK
jgi:hypothetical protein